MKKHKKKKKRRARRRAQPAPPAAVPPAPRARVRWVAAVCRGIRDCFSFGLRDDFYHTDYPEPLWPRYHVYYPLHPVCRKRTPDGKKHYYLLVRKW